MNAHLPGPVTPQGVPVVVVPSRFPEGFPDGIRRSMRAPVRCGRDASPCSR